MTDISTNEPNEDEEEIYNWHDLDDCMTAFMGRLSPLQRANNWDPEYVAAVEYYMAFDLALWDDSKTRLAILLKKRTPIPPEFLALISDILLGKSKKNGRPKRFSKGSEINLYIQMCSLHYDEKMVLARVFKLMCDRAAESGVDDVDPKKMERLWKDCESNETLKRVFGSGGQNPT